MVKPFLLLASCALFLVGCDDNSDSAAILLGGGSGSSNNTQNVFAPPANPAGGIPTDAGGITTVASEFGYIDDPNGTYHGNGDPGTSGNFYTGAGGQYIGGQDSTGISLPAQTEIQYYGSTSAAQNQPVQITNLDNGESVTTTIVDVGPGNKSQAAGYGADVTFGTARAIGAPIGGGERVQITPLTNKSFEP